MISELNIFRLFLYNEKFRKKAQSLLDIKLFNNTYISELLQLTFDYYAKHLEIPSDNIKMLIYNNPLKQDKTIIEEKINIVDVDISYYEEMDLDIFMPDFERWLKNQKFVCLLQDGIEDWEKAQEKNECMVDLLSHQQKTKNIMEISFENNIGIDVSNASLMFEQHTRKDRRIKFHSKELNRVTKGGCKIPSLNMIAGPPHSGKTRGLCSIAADYLMAKRNVLYVTLEMSDTDISKFIDFILIDKKESEIDKMKYEEYEKIKEKSLKNQGKLIVKEYPTSSANTGHIRILLNELRYKGFIPDVLIIDYIGIMQPERKNNGKLYETGKIISEELRGLGGMSDLVVWTGAQINRTGAQKKNGGGMEDLAESYALNMTGDFIMIAVINDELKSHGNQLFKIVKNRPGGRTDLCLLAEIPKDEYRVNFISVDETSSVIEDQNSYDTQELKNKFNNSNDINNNKFKVGIGAK